MGQAISGGANVSEWTYINSSTTGDFTSVPAYEAYKLVGTVSISGGGWGVNLNNDGGLNYTARNITTNAVTNTTTGAAISMLGGSVTTGSAYFELFILGKTQAVAGGRLSWYILTPSDNAIGIAGYWAGGNAVQVTRINSSGPISGKYMLYGRNLI